ncbi:MAG: peptide ABC transporter substrate-binding protein [Euzebya sp.]
MNRRLLQLLALMATLMLFAAACSGSDTAEEPADSGASDDTATTDSEEPTDEATTDDEPTTEDTASEAAPSGDGGSYSLYVCEPENLLPANSSESCGNQVLQSLYTNLIEYDPETTESVNTVADSIETEDSQTFTITVADGWSFHDGEPITAATFVDTFNFVTDPDGAYQNSFFYSDIEGTDDGGLRDAETLTGVELVDDMTFTVTLKNPFSAWPLRLGYRAFSPLPTACREDPDACNEAPIGNGPYQMDGTWNHDVNISVTKWEDYPGENPGVADAIEFRIFSDVETALLEVEAGTLDALYGVPGPSVEQARSTFGDRFIERPVSTYTYVGFPMYDAAYGGDENLQLRQALSLAVDRQAITDVILPQQFPADSLISPVVPGYSEGACEFCQYDPDRALELWNEHGGLDSIVMWFNSGAGHEEWVEAIANQWRDTFGLADDAITFESVEFADYLSNFLDPQAITGPFRLGWGMDYPSPENYLAPLYFTDADSNFFGYSNPDFEALVREGNQAADVDEGIALYQEAEQLVLADMPAIPLFFSNGSAVHSENVDNVVVSAFGQIRPESVTPVN